MSQSRIRLLVISICLGLFSVSLFLQYGCFEEFPTFPYFDEVYSVPASRVVVSNPTEMAKDHPPLVPYMMSISNSIFGDGPLGWRFPSRLFGSLTLPAIFLIGMLLTGTIAGPLIGSIALLFDGIFLTLSRTALWDTPCVCFGLYGVLFALYGGKQQKLSRALLAWLSSGLLLGLSMSSKWNGIFFYVPIAFAQLFTLDRHALRYRLATLASTPILGLIIYIFITSTLRQLSIYELYAQTIELFNLHINFSFQHRYASSAWTWPLLPRPIWLGYLELPYMASDGSQAVRGTVCLGNPIVFLFTGLSILWLLGYTLKNVISRRISLAATLPLVGYLSCWTPWLTLSVRKGFIYYFYPSLAFGCIGLGVVATWMLSKGVLGKIVSWSVVILCVACGILYFPVYLGIPTSRAHMDLILFVKTWW